MKNIEMLWELQQQEDKIIQIEKETGITDLKNEITNCKQSYNKVLSIIKQLAEEYKEREAIAVEIKSEISDIIMKIAHDEEKLYNGSIKKVKALNQMQKEIEDLKEKQLGKNQDLEKIKYDNLSTIKTIRKYKAKSERIKEKILECNGSLKKRAQSNQLQMADVDKKIKEIKGFLTTEEIKYYYDKKDKIYPVVVCYKEDSCDGCKMQFSLIFSQNIRKNVGKIHVCENCGRLIYIPKLQEA
ncbi:MAG: hypothetical protein ACOWWR_18790 [Eubacteriales bacterium]